jgi:hypothetical protein
MRYTAIIGSQADYLQHQSIKPKYYPCPQCGTKGKCAPESLPRLGAHAPPAPAHCHGDEYRAGDCLAQGRTFRRAPAEAGTLCAVGATSAVTPGSSLLR